mgnify:CR=1 FL=1
MVISNIIFVGFWLDSYAEFERNGWNTARAPKLRSGFYWFEYLFFPCGCWIWWHYWSMSIIFWQCATAHHIMETILSSIHGPINVFYYIDKYIRIRLLRLLWTWINLRWANPVPGPDQKTGSGSVGKTMNPDTVNCLRRK